MTLEELNAKVREWDSQHSGDPAAKAKFSTIFNQLSYHASREWRVYLPAEHSDFNSSFMDRLAAWVGNVPLENDQKLLLEYALCISFFSHEDFAALYRTAMDREIKRWVAEQIGARLTPLGGQAFHDRIDQQIHRHTWFCPITDSMDINEFYKVNHLKGIGHRPGFATLEMLAQRADGRNAQLVKSLRHYMANPSLDPANPAPPLERIVLIEDIVGSGTQCVDSIRWAVANLRKPVLFIPLILCPNGIVALREEERLSHGRLTVRPVVELRRSDLLGPERQGAMGLSIAAAMEELALRFTPIAFANVNTFGYRDTGCSLATFANTPDNTLPIVHYKGHPKNWEPLFPRVYRD